MNRHDDNDPPTEMRQQGLWPAVASHLYNFHTAGKKKDIFIFSAPRSGSTFLMELLQSQRDAKIYNEILNVRNPTVCEEIGLSTWEESTTFRNREDLYYEYIMRLKSNKIPAMNRPFYWRTGRLFSKRIVFKIIHGGEDMLEWFGQTFSDHLLFLIRHPVPTALSHHIVPRLPYYFGQPGLASFFTAEQKSLWKRSFGNDDLFQMAVIDWCIQNRPLLQTFRRANATFLTYEDLVLDPSGSFSRLKPNLELESPLNLSRLIGRPSRSTLKGDIGTRSTIRSQNQDRRFLIEKWQAMVTPEQLKFTQSALDTFEIDIYRAESPYPVTAASL